MPGMVAPGVRLDRSGPVGWIVFANPERRNALTAGMLGQALERVEEVAADDSIRVVVLRGDGDAAFISGADITAFGSSEGVDAGVGPGAVTAAITGLGKPVVAALRGWCLGAGALVALAADLRVAGDDLRFGIPAAKLGIAYPRDGVDRLVDLAGPATAGELLMTGDPIDAAAAQRTGLVNRVVPAVDVFAAAAALAERLAANAPLSMLAAKRAIAGDDAADAAIVACYESDDFAEGRRAFAERRPPTFEGR